MKKSLRLPTEMSEDLAELVGIHFGDGCMRRTKDWTYVILYSLNLRDKEYAMYVRELFHRIFGYWLIVREIAHKSEITLTIHSKNLCSYYNEFLEVPYSPKRDLRVPEWIKQNKVFLAKFICGLFDTDGCQVIQQMGKYKYILLKFSTRDLIFAEEIKESLSILGLKSYICDKGIGYDVTIRNKDSRHWFLANVSPQNNKNGAAGTFTSRPNV